MKNFLVFLLVVGALYFVWKSDLLGLGLNRNPSAIANPVYGVIRLRAEFQDRTINAVELAKTFDQADCARNTKDAVDRMTRQQNQGSALMWQLVSSECKSVLDSPDLKLFDNKPSFTNYLSAAPGDSSERELRLIFWGVTAQEGDSICAEIPRLKDRWHGTVTCIQALPSQ